MKFVLSKATTKAVCALDGGMPETTDKGGRKPRVSDSELVDVFRSTPDPVLSTREVADAVPIKRRATLNRLQSLEEDGELDSKQIGGRNTVWWRRDADADTHGAESAPTGEAGSGTRRVDAGPTTAVDFPDAVDDAVSEMASGDELPDTRTPALREAVTQLRQDGEATVDDLVGGAYQREAGGFTRRDSYRRSITAALDALAERRAEIGTDGDRYVWHGGEGE